MTPSSPEATIPTLSGARLWLGAFRVFLADLGVSSVLGFLLGFSLGVVFGATEEATRLLTIIGTPLGFLVSLFAGFVLSRRVSSSPMGLVALVITAIVFLAVSSSVEFVTGARTLENLLMLGVAQIAVYAVGWYGARTYALKVWVPGKTTITTFAVIGGIMVFLTVLGVIANFV